MEEHLSRIAEEWFLTEPLLFSAWCTHAMTENRTMSVPMRTGKMRIEYNPGIIADWTDGAVEERLRAEVIRILLGHPYQRQPYKARKEVLGLASDVTLVCHYRRIKTIELPPDLRFDRGLCFEEYYSVAEEYLDRDRPPVAGGEEEDRGEEKEVSGEVSRLAALSGMSAEASELWEEDELAAEPVREAVRTAVRTGQWGSLAGDLRTEIEASAVVRLDYRTALYGFSVSVISLKRRLTRMRPNRRYGFRYMGGRHELAARLLVAVDVSGSVRDGEVSQALSVVNRFFRYGVETVDVALFDAALRGSPLSVGKAVKTLRIEGRGGTDFQPPVDFFLKSRYDGLVVITDGRAPRPDIPTRFRGHILWMLYDDGAYRKGSRALPEHCRWIAALPRSRYALLPPAGPMTEK